MMASLSWWTTLRGGLVDWKQIDAFGQGYTQAGGILTVEEAVAVPLLALMRMVCILAYFCGRCRVGLDPWHGGPLAWLVEVALDFDDWLAQNETAFVRRCRVWAQRSE